MNREQYSHAADLRGAAVSGLRLPSTGLKVRRALGHPVRHGGIWLGLLALALFFRACGFEFLSWDRELFSTRSPATFGVFWTGLLAAFQTVAPWDGAFGPLTVISHMLDFQLFGFSPVSHHLTSIWLHVCNAVLLFSLLRGTSKSIWIASLATAMFALHPLQVAPVVWISQRRTLLATLFVFLTLTCWTRSRRTISHRYRAAALLAFLMAALSDPASAIVVLLFLPTPSGPPNALRVPGLEAAPATPSCSQPWPERRLLIQAPFLAVLITIAAWASLLPSGQAGTPTATARSDLWSAAGLLATSALDVLSALSRSLANLLTFRPAGTVPALDPTHISGGDLSLALAGLLLIYAGWRSRKIVGRQVPLGLTWFSCCGIAAAVFRRADALAPIQWTYLGNAGLALAAAALAARVLAAIGHRKLIRFAIPAAILGTLWSTSREISRWSGSQAVTSRALSSNPSGRQAWRAWHALGVYQLDEKKDAEAARSFRQALSFEFDSRTLSFLANLAHQQGKTNRAELLFQEIIREQQLPALGYSALGRIAEERGDLAGAASRFSAALRAEPGNIEALIGLAKIRAAAPEPWLRNGPEALDKSARAISLTNGKSLRAISAAAAAHAELGEFRRAQALATRAAFWIARVGTSNEVASCRQQLENYKAGKPWRIPPVPSAPTPKP